MTTTFLQNNLYVVLIVALGNVLSFLYTIESNETGYIITQREYPQLRDFIAEVRARYSALRQSGTNAPDQFLQNQLEQINGLLTRIVVRFPQVASVLSPEVMNTLNSIQITRPNVQAAAARLNHRIIEGVTRVGELLGDLYTTVYDFLYDTGYNRKNPEQMAALSEIIEEQMEARNIALIQTEQNEKDRAAAYAAALAALREALTSVIELNLSSFTGSGSTNVSAASSRASSVASSRASVASSRASRASSRASVLVGSLGVELGKLSNTSSTLPSESVTALLNETDELVGYMKVPTENPDTSGASQGSQDSAQHDQEAAAEKETLITKYVL
jgi:hypothetical protein